ncbi:hypothetical protein [Achromobacter ruhlandii]|uniref:Leucine-rich repeat domain-containing protein n=1 Tax=Achromobacter ruhlandii TaxID=72557 RepID=A0ABM8LZW6_9BURK|nr:hypothetical protein [Achromobacter ruhlandii]AKP90126.1 hypothetical protein Axylo_2633 [Achromobacter xylosoxidans]CAB3954833.1 hypothetical protein LMG7053_04541 [Achromobacter ruhlandii]
MSEPIDVSGQPAGSVTGDGRFRLDLTGPGSHVLVTEPGRGNLVIGPAGMGRKADLHVAPDDAIHWPALALYGQPLAQAISLQGIERFPALERLSLWGAFTDWQALARLPGLKSLEIRYSPDLDGLPPLDTWPLLERFIGFNVDEAAGKRLKSQLKAREKARPWADYTSVSKLRAPQWWQSEYGRPFAGWSARAAKSANTAYDAALAALAEAADVQAVQAAIAAFAAHFNGMKGIETSEREDIGEAVWQFSQHARLAALGVSEDQAQAWFDAVRDY